jgi:phage baseplate assembly protein W
MRKRDSNIVKLQVQKENIRESMKSILERPTSTRLEIRTYVANMFRIIFTQGAENIVTRDLSTMSELKYSAY